MSEFMDALRARVAADIAPIREVYGSEAPVVIMASKILAAAEEVEQQIMSRWVRTSDASSMTGWSVETLQKYARMKVAGEPLPELWAGLDAETDLTGFRFVVGSIPSRAREAA